MSFNPHGTRLADFPVWLRNGTGAAAPPVAIPAPRRTRRGAGTGAGESSHYGNTSGSTGGRRSRAAGEQGAPGRSAPILLAGRSSTHHHPGLASAPLPGHRKHRHPTANARSAPRPSLLQHLPPSPVEHLPGPRARRPLLPTSPRKEGAHRPGHHPHRQERIEHHATAAATYLLGRPDLLHAYAMHQDGTERVELHVLEGALAGRALRVDCRAHCPAYPGAVTLPANAFAGEDGCGALGGLEEVGEDDNDENSVIPVH